MQDIKLLAFGSFMYYLVYAYCIYQSLIDNFIARCW